MNNTVSTLTQTQILTDTDNQNPVVDTTNIIDAEYTITSEDIPHELSESKELVAVNDNNFPTLPTDPTALPKYITLAKKYIEAETKLLNGLKLTSNRYHLALRTTQEHASLLLLAELRLSEMLKGIKTCRGMRTDINKKKMLSKFNHWVKSKKEIIKQDFKLSPRQARDIEKLTSECIKKAVEIAKENNTIPTRSLALSQLPKREKDETAIVVHTLDRLQRGFGECEKIKELLKADKIEVHFIQEAFILDKFSSDDDFTRYDFGILSAKLYLTSMNRNVKRSQKHNREAGLWQGLAPIGYLNAKDERKRATLILDPERAPIIKQIFEEYATGDHSIQSVWKSALDKGFTSKEPNYNPRSKNFGIRCPVSKNKIHDILTNPFYYGCMYVADEEIDEKTKKPIKTFYKKIQHVYEPIISKELFDKVQTILKSKNKENFCKEQKYAGISFSLRGLIKCECGCMMTPERHKKKGNVYTYLRCPHRNKDCKQYLVPEETILNQLNQEIFKKIRISPTMRELLKTSIIQSLEDEKKINANVRKKITDEIFMVDSKLERLWESYLDRVIDKPKYESEKENISHKKENLKKKPINIRILPKN